MAAIRFDRIGAIIGLVVVGAHSAWADPRLEFFEKQIRPVLMAHCVECHGPDKSESDLRVDHITFLKRPGTYGPVLVPGQPDQSSLYTSLTHESLDLRMPYQREPLNRRIREDIRQWIEQGAVWPDEPLVSRDADRFDEAARKARLPWIWQVPQPQPLPTVDAHGWSRTEVDPFILARLEQAGLAPAPDATDDVWLRRVSFALTGLPPTTEQWHRFQQQTAPQRYEQAVDELLQSPHFGERWARHWMDLVRYAESRGHESDFDIANAWHYRDYLIRAFNDDLPYDQMILEHMAGDLISPPRLHRVHKFHESILATAWPFFGEEVHSPVDIRQDECERLDNKIDVFSKTFLGLTVACARCHDHKFDAISQQDYYGLAGFFLSSHFRQVRFDDVLVNRQIAEELAQLEQSTQAALAMELAHAIRPQLATVADTLLDAITSDTGDIEGTDRDSDPLRSLWRQQIREAQSNVDHPLHLLYQPQRDPQSDRIAPPPTNDVAPDSHSQQTIVDYSQPTTPWHSHGYLFGHAPRMTGDLLLPHNANGSVGGVVLQGHARRDPFWYALTLAPGNQVDSGLLNAVGRSAGFLSTPTFELRDQREHDGELHIRMEGETQVYAAVDSHLMIIGPLHHQLIATLKSPEPAWVRLDLRHYRGHRLHLEFGPVGTAPLTVWKVVEGTPPDDPPVPHPAQPLREEIASAVSEIVQHLHTSLDALMAQQWGSQDNCQRLATAIDWMLQSPQLFPVSAESHARQRAIVAAYHARRTELAQQVQASSRTAIAWFDGSGVEEQVLLRGKYQSPGERAPRRLPAAFGWTMPASADVSADGIAAGRNRGSGRLVLAQQLISPANPLVARVMINRIWHHLMGRGIVESVDNFGWLGQRPTHPELLDHLAHRFVHVDHWSLKRMIRRIVLSRTFAMSSHPADAATEELDPANQLFHRMPVRRLEAETIRDHVLSVSGRLDHRQLGASVPVHLTEFVVGRGRPEASGPLDGAGRRSIYLSVRRNFLPTLLITFDMPIPFSTVGRRNITNVPAQTLALMNDPFIYEQANVWADSLLHDQPTATADERIKTIYWQALGRPPAADEVAAIRTSLEEIARHQRLPRDDRRVWTEICHAVFSLNEFTHLR